MHIENTRSKDNDPITNTTNNRELESLTREELIDLLRKSNDRIDAIITNSSDRSSAVFSPTTYQTEVGRKQGGGESSTTTENESIRNLTQNLRHKYVRVGIGVLIRDPHHPTHIFSGTRRGSHGAGTLALPGGHLEKFEKWEECATREVMEETGLKVEGVQFGYVTNDVMIKEDKHYVTIFVMCECVEEENGGKQVPRNLEPEKCDGWGSYSWDDLRKRLDPAESEGKAGLFGPLRRLVEDSPDNVVQFLKE